MLIYLECEDRAQRTPFLRLMVLLTFFLTQFIPENPASSSVFQACLKHQGLIKLFIVKHLT